MIAEQANQTARKTGARKAPKRSAARRSAKGQEGPASPAQKNAGARTSRQA
jgi:hypothetical protein